VSEPNIKLLLWLQKHYIHCQVKPYTFILILWDIKGGKKLENKVKLSFHCTGNCTFSIFSLADLGREQYYTMQQGP
jgi:hypothetical protein